MAGADGLEFQEDISLRRLRLGERTVLTLLSPSHGRSVRNRGREHRIATGEGSSAFLSPFGMTSTRRRENADHADSGSSGHPGAVILSHSIERSLPEVQSELEFPSLLTMGSLVSPKRRESSHQSMLREEVGILASFP